MGAYHNALREEGSRDDLLEALEKAWDTIDSLESGLDDLANHDKLVNKMLVRIADLEATIVALEVQAQVAAERAKELEPLVRHKDSRLDLVEQSEEALRTPWYKP